MTRSAVNQPRLAMKPTPYDDYEARVQWSTAFAQPLFPGFRVLAWKSEPGRVVMRSQANRPVAALGHLTGVLKNLALPADVFLDGLVWRQGLSFRRVQAACCRYSAATEQLQYHLTDVGSARSFADRIAQASAVCALVSSDLLVTVPTVKVRNRDEFMVAQQEFIEEGFDGAVLRHGARGYEAGQFSTHFLEARLWEDRGFKVVDWKPGRDGRPVLTCTTALGQEFDVRAHGGVTNEEARAAVGRHLAVRFHTMTGGEEDVPHLPAARGWCDA